MSDDKEKPTDSSLDIFGVKPIAHAIEKVTDVTVDKAAGFLTLICRPAAEEYGLLLQDKVKATRAINSVKLLLKAQNKFRELGLPRTFHAQPRLVARILEEGSWIDDDNLQEMWAGLLTSSCSADGEDDSNLVYVNYLSQITKLQARILNYGCTHSSLYINADGDVWPQMYQSPTTMMKLAGELQESSSKRIGVEANHLNVIGLLAHNLSVENEPVYVNPSPLGIQLYVRCQGTPTSPAEYFGLRKGQQDQKGDAENSAP